jgi:hypothetical protein
MPPEGEAEVQRTGSGLGEFQAGERPCVIQRMVAHGCRAMRDAQAEADMRTTVDTARLGDQNPFAVIVPKRA